MNEHLTKIVGDFVVVAYMAFIGIVIYAALSLYVRK